MNSMIFPEYLLLPVTKLEQNMKVIIKISKSQYYICHGYFRNFLYSFKYFQVYS